MLFNVIYDTNRIYNCQKIVLKNIPELGTAENPTNYIHLFVATTACYFYYASIYYENLLDFKIF